MHMVPSDNDDDQCISPASVKFLHLSRKFQSYRLQRIAVSYKISQQSYAEKK
jgi:hypothetical protein